MPLSVNHMCMIRSFHTVTAGEKIIFPNYELRGSMEIMEQGESEKGNVFFLNSEGRVL